MKTIRILSAACLAACCLIVHGEETNDLRATVAQLEKALHELSDRVAALEGKPQPKSEPEDKPEESEVQKLLTQIAGQNSSGVIDIVGFRKLDGLPSKEAGVRYYAMKCEVDVQFGADCIWQNIIGAEGPVTFGVALPPRGKKGGGGWDDFMYVSQNPGLRVTRGQVLRITGILSFEKSESVWRLRAFNSEAITHR